MFGNNKNELQKNPYPGIRSFETEESQLFFGRTAQINDLYNILIKTHFIAITGASGSGKSSLVKAGLIPKLYKENNSWSHCIFRPGNNPVANFAKAIASNNNSEYSANEIEKKMRDSDASVNELFDSENKKINHLIYIDQFEEIFRFKQKEELQGEISDSELFVNLIVNSAKNTSGNLYIVLSLRTDFLGDCSEFSGLTKVINEGHYLIPKMTLKEKEEALTGPAEVAGAVISDDLKELIKNHLKNHNVSLPVFQHALMRTWDYWLENAEYGKPVDVEHYEAIGTVSHALSVHAEYIFSSLADNGKRKIAEKVFKSLTYLGSDKRGTRSPKSFSDIIEILNERKEDIQEVIDVFRDEKNGFLMPPKSVRLLPDTLIDISHESIMVVWDRLVQWVQSETESAQLYLRLSKSAELYQVGKTGLLKNPDLELALKWLDENQPNEVWAKRYDPAFDRAINYLLYSKKKWENEIKAKEEKQKRGLKRARFFAVFLGSASLISILFLVIAINLKFKADDSKRKALEKEKIAVSKSAIAEEKKKEAVSNKRIAEQQQSIAEEQRLIAEKNKQYAVNQQREALMQKRLALIAKHDAVRARDIARELQVKAEKLRDDALKQKQIAEEQKNRAEVSEAKTDTLRRLAVAKSLAALAEKVFNDNKKAQKLTDYDKKLPKILALQAYYFNKDYKGNPNDADIFSALTKVSDDAVILRGKDIHTDGVRDIAVSKNGKYFISCSDDGSVKLFNIQDPEKRETLHIPYITKVAIRSVDIDLTGEVAVAGTYSGDILLWKNIALENKAVILKGHSSVVNKVCLSKDYKSVYSVSNDGTFRKWNIGDGTNTSIVIYQTTEKLTALAVSPDGNTLSVGTASGDVIVFPAGDYANKTILKGNKRVMSLTWKDNKSLIAGYSDGMVRIYENNEVADEFYAHISGVSSLVYDKNFNRLISSSYDGLVKIWNYANLKLEPISLNGHSSWVYTAAVTPDGKRVISGGADKQIIINFVVSDEIKNELRKQVSKNMTETDWLRFVGKGIEYKPELPND